MHTLMEPPIRLSNLYAVFVQLRDGIFPFASLAYIINFLKTDFYQVELHRGELRQTFQVLCMECQLHIKGA
jgi:hypothetical protein